MACPFFAVSHYHLPSAYNKYPMMPEKPINLITRRSATRLCGRSIPFDTKAWNTEFEYVCSRMDDPGVVQRVSWRVTEPGKTFESFPMISIIGLSS